jgi:hypothetical protein
MTVHLAFGIVIAQELDFSTQLGDSDTTGDSDRPNYQVVVDQTPIAKKIGQSLL